MQRSRDARLMGRRGFDKGAVTYFPAFAVSSA